MGEKEQDSIFDDYDRLEEALQKILSWSEAYPADVFPEPNWKQARALLAAGGITLDAVAGSCMRRVVEGIGKIAKEALDKCAALTQNEHRKYTPSDYPLKPFNKSE